MRWFKHFNDALDDPFIQELLDNFSHAGYVAWFGLLEIIAKENGNKLTGKLSIDPVYLKRKMHISVKKLGEIYEFCSRKPKENSEKTQRKLRLFYDKTLEKWEFYIPKMLELKDNYTKDLQATGKKPSNHKEAEAEAEAEDKDIPQNEFAEHSEDFYLTKKKRKLKGKSFEKFWSAYPKKKSKGQAEKTFKKLNPDSDLLEKILKSISIQEKTDQWIKDNGKFIQNPSTWLNAKGWEDEEIFIKNTDSGKTAAQSEYEETLKYLKQ